MITKIILLIDAIINLILGILLLAFSQQLANFLGVPFVESYFYPNILGAVLFGIGLALLIEYYRKEGSFIGLGLGGAISINLCGGIALALWLIMGNLSISFSGYIFLWTLVFLLIGVSFVEFIIFFRKTKKPDNIDA